MRRFNREVVAVRWMCSGCDDVAVGPPDRLPEGWVEVPPAPWLAAEEPRYACGRDAGRLLDRTARQWATFEERRYLVTAAELETLRLTVRRVAADLERLRLSGQRVGNP